MANFDEILLFANSYISEIEVLAGNRNFTKNRRAKIATIIIFSLIFSPSIS